MKYIEIVNHYENCLMRHGATHKGVDWPNLEDAIKRQSIMLQLIKDNEYSTLLDFGCGIGMLLEYICNHNINNIKYTGFDISQKYIDVCLSKFSDNEFICGDILHDSEILTDFDYIVMNGVFTEKHSLTHLEMYEYFKKMISIVFAKCNKGLAFNVMSKHVDWERDDLFHLPFDELVGFLKKNQITNNFVIRNDYGLYEYTVYLYK